MTRVLLTLAQVEAKVQKKKSWIYSEPGFPQPIKMGKVNRWVESEIDAYIEDQIRARDGTPAQAQA